MSGGGAFIAKQACLHCSSPPPHPPPGAILLHQLGAGVPQGPLLGSLLPPHICLSVLIVAACLSHQHELKLIFVST